MDVHDVFLIKLALVLNCLQFYPDYDLIFYCKEYHVFRKFFVQVIIFLKSPY